MQIELKAVLHGGTVDLGYQPAGACQRLSVEARTLSEGHQFIRRPARVLAATSADMDAQFALQRGQSALQGADHAGRDAG
jgi:hypothetical protein